MITDKEYSYNINFVNAVFMGVATFMTYNNNTGIIGIYLGTWENFQPNGKIKITIDPQYTQSNAHAIVLGY